MLSVLRANRAGKVYAVVQPRAAERADTAAGVWSNAADTANASVFPGGAILRVMRHAADLSTDDGGADISGTGDYSPDVGRPGDVCAHVDSAHHGCARRAGADVCAHHDLANVGSAGYGGADKPRTNDGVADKPQRVCRRWGTRSL